MSDTQTYIVSARKYRPQTFDTIVGQESVTNTLKNSILSGNIAQAYLFFGPRGVGKTTCARVFAKTINCQNLKPQDVEACNECVSCKSFNSNTSFNIYELDAASNNSVEDIRQLIDQVRYPPQIGKYKVYIIDEVHMLSTAAFNAFLKTLEEPPAHAKFILATTERNKVLPTILSRCQVFSFNRIKTEDIANYLKKIAKKENHKYEDDALTIIAQKADGGLRDACSIFDQMAAYTSGNITKEAVVKNLHILDYDYYFNLTNAIINQQPHSVLLMLDEILKKGFDLQNVLVGLIDHMRYLLIAKDPQVLYILDLSDTVKTSILQQTKQCSERFLLNALSILNKTDVGYKSAIHQRLHIEIHLLQLCNLIQQIKEAEEKKNLISNQNTSPGTVINPDEQPTSYPQNHKIKIIKVTDKPVINNATISTTTSLKAQIEAKAQPQKQEIPITQNTTNETISSEKKEDIIEKPNAEQPTINATLNQQESKKIVFQDTG